MTTSRFKLTGPRGRAALRMACATPLVLALPACGFGGGSEVAASESVAPRGATSEYAAGVKRSEQKESDDAAAPKNSTKGMVQIPAGTVKIEGKTHEVAGFWMDAYEVTNREFETFVKATGFVTEAERIGNSVVFFHDRAALGERPFDVVDGAYWRAPKGAGSNLEGKADHPVVHVSWNDATAYAKWCGKRLAKRAEWIHAASAGNPKAVYPWGTELQPMREPMMNAWQGTFPVRDKGIDGFRGTSPAGYYPPNEFGLYDVSGNVWEWTGERATVGDGPDDEVAEKRGGSFLCREEAALGFHACRGYQISSFEWSSISNGNDNVGFRCVR